MEEGAAQNDTAEEKLPASGSEDSDDENSQVPSYCVYHICFFLTLTCTAVIKYLLLTWRFTCTCLHTVRKSNALIEHALFTAFIL